MMKRTDYFDDYVRATDGIHKLNMMMIDVLYDHVQDRATRKRLLLKSQRIADVARRVSKGRAK